MDLCKNDSNSFMAALRSGSLLKFLESNQKHYQNIINTMDFKIKQCEEDIMQKRLLFQQNSLLTEEFQNQIHELSEQNSKYAEQQQELLDENLNLRNQLLSSEEKFAELDIAYDEQVFALTNKITELEAQNTDLGDIHNKALDEVIKAEKAINEDLRSQLEKERLEFQAEINKANEQVEALMKSLIESEALVDELRSSLASDSDKDHEIQKLKDGIENLNNERVADQNKFRQEKAQMIVLTENLKLELESCKDKMVTQERKISQAYMKYKQLSRITAAISDPPPLNPSLDSVGKRKQSSGDVSSDSDSSSISFCNLRKRRKPEERVPLHQPGVKNKQSANVAPLIFTRGQVRQRIEEEIPETSSSIRSNQE